MSSRYIHQDIATFAQFRSTEKGVWLDFGPPRAFRQFTIRRPASENLHISGSHYVLPPMFRAIPGSWPRRIETLWYGVFRPTARRKQAVQTTGTTVRGQRLDNPLAQLARRAGAGMLQVSVQKRLGDVRIDVAFATMGGATALFGPSGSGKTSVLNMIAGLIKPDKGSITLGDVALFDHARRLAVPAHKRRIGYVFQEHRLFPHMSVKKNLDYGRRMNGLPYDPEEEARVLSMLGIRHLLDRRLHGLSGGEPSTRPLGG